MPTIYKSTHILLIVAYVMSLLFITVKVSSGSSLAFVLGVALIVSKLWGVSFCCQSFRVGKEGVLLLGLYLYLLGVDMLVHGGSVINAYYMSFGINVIVFLVLVDEFRKNMILRDKVMQVFFATAFLVALLFIAGIYTTESQSGRFTFMRQNENDFALNLLIALAFAATSFVYAAPKNRLSFVVLFAGTMVILNALIGTGSRYAILGECSILLLLAANTFLRRSSIKICVLYICSILTFIALKTISFQPISERFSPTVVGNNLEDLGGRLPLWKTSMDVFWEHPFIGVGYDGFQQYVLQTEKYFGMPHNIFMEIAATGGAIGVLLLFALACFFITCAILHFVRFRVLEGFIWGGVVFIASIMLNITHMKAFWFLAAYFIAVTSTTNTNTNTNTNITDGDAGRHVS
jgi:O-antigen ligase